jgi:thiol-disulfide isomerase/thioredoxin
MKVGEDGVRRQLCRSLLCLFLIVSATVGCSDHNPSEPSQPEPVLLGIGPYGEIITVDQFRGRILVANFWASWCGPCQRQLPELAQLEREYGGKVTVLAISIREPADRVRAFLEEQSYELRVAFDEDGWVASNFQIRAIPADVLFDGEGVMRGVVVGYDPGLGDLRELVEQILEGE